MVTSQEKIFIENIKEGIAQVKEHLKPTVKNYKDLYHSIDISINLLNKLKSKMLERDSEGLYIPINARPVKKLPGTIYQLEELIANSKSFIHPEDCFDGNKIWLDDIRALENAIAIIKAYKED